MVKMVVSDFDGTLMNYPDKFTEGQIRILKELRSKGIIFGIVTGRNVSFFEQFPSLLELTDFIISSNGGSIYDVKNKSFIFNSCINDDDLNKLIKLGINNNYTFIINELDKKYKYGDLKKIESFDFDYNRQYKAEQLIFYIENNILDNFLETIKNYNGININYINKKENVTTIDVTFHSVNKGNAVSWLCNYLRIVFDDVIAFGDGENDISVFKIIDKCICVDNACLELKKYAFDFTLSCDENGVFKYIEDNILKQ